MQQRELIKDYYGKVLASKNDLKTTACCAAETLVPHLSRLVAQVHEEVRAKFYGCGVPIPSCLEGLTVLDLGCGSRKSKQHHRFQLSKFLSARRTVTANSKTSFAARAR